MAGAGLRVVRRRIKTVESTKKITRAMELIATSRVVRAQSRASQARPYAEKITGVIRNVAASAGGDVSHPLLAEREEAVRGFIVLTADRGLAGAYNSNVLRIVERQLRQLERAGTPGKVFVVGRKGLSYLRYRRFDVARNFLGISEQPSYADAAALGGAVMEAYAAGDVDRVDLVYTEFLSLGSQRPGQLQILPVPVPRAGDADMGGVDAAAVPSSGASYEFEPSPADILGRLLPSYVRARLFTALLEAAASEQAARRRAMKAATDNADDLIKVLVRTANQARQAEITTEISEIVGGAEALAEARE